MTPIGMAPHAIATGTCKNTRMDLTNRYLSFIESGLAKDRHSPAQLADLSAALIEGEESGASAPFDFDAFIASKRSAPPMR